LLIQIQVELNPEKYHIVKVVHFILKATSKDIIIF